MTKIVNIDEAKKHFDQLVDSAAAGPRQPGMFSGLVVPDTFFEPLPAEEQSMWDAG